MLTLQELIGRGIYIFADAPGRLNVFEMVDGKRSVNEIAETLNRKASSIRRDITKIRDAGLIEYLVVEGDLVKKGRSPVYKKIDLANIVPLSTFRQESSIPVTPTNVMPISLGRTSDRLNHVHIRLAQTFFLCGQEHQISYFQL